MAASTPDYFTAVVAEVRILLDSGPLLPALVEQSGRTCGRSASDAHLDFGTAAARCSQLFADALDVSPYVGEAFAQAFVEGYDGKRRGD